MRFHCSLRRTPYVQRHGRRVPPRSSCFGAFRLTSFGLVVGRPRPVGGQRVRGLECSGVPVRVRALGRVASPGGAHFLILSSTSPIPPFRWRSMNWFFDGLAYFLKGNIRHSSPARDPFCRDICPLILGHLSCCVQVLLVSRCY